MSWRRLRLVRVLRVAWAVGRVMPRYVWLNLRGARADQRAWDRAHELAADELRRVALLLEGAFTKAAQIGGARADVLPEPFIDKLSQFHDAVPSRDFAELRHLVERAVGGDIDGVFASIEPRAIAAASLAQVHRARLHDGREVAVKIQYPEIRRIIPLDLGMLRRVAQIAHHLQSRIDLRSLVNEVTRFIELELDFRREVDSTEEMGRILADDDGVVVPRVHRELCSDDVIVLEFLDGIQVSRLEALEAAGHERADVARRIGALYGAMIFEHGTFHGDPHPGNLLVLEDGRIGLLDYGLCKALPKGFSRNIAQMMVSAMIGDDETAFEAARALGFDTAAIRPDHLRSLMLSVIGDSDTDESVFEILSESRLPSIPEDFALVARTLVLLNGLSFRLAPGRRLIQAQLVEHLAAGVAAEPAPPALAG